MAEIKIEGYAYSWDAELVGGPFDGLIDTVVQLVGHFPPKIIHKTLKGDVPLEGNGSKAKVGEKMLEFWGKYNLPDDLKVALYDLRGCPEDFDGEEEDVIIYDFNKVTIAKELKGME